MSEGQSFSNMEFMNSLPVPLGWERLNANPAGLTVEQIEIGTIGHAYIENLIKRKSERYENRYHRHEVVCSDPIATFVCERWIEEITSKPFKTYDETQENEIMMDVWERVNQLNMNEIYCKIYPKWAADGFCLTQLGVGLTGAPVAKCFGYFESPPDFWKRYNLNKTPYRVAHNTIYEYYVSYIPIPMGYGYMGNYNIHAEEEWLYPQDPNFFHFYRKEYNFGIGKPRLQGIWASLTKLRKMAHADYRRALVFNILEYPEDMNDTDVEPLIEAARRADETEGVAVPMRVNQQSGEVLEFPRFRERTWDEQGGAPRSDPSAGGSLLRHSEYARVLIALGYTETKLVGSQPGEVTGSKLDLTRDDEVDIREFNLFKPVIKQLNQWLLMNGFFEGCEQESLELLASGEYDIKCHVEWEVIENMMMAAEQAEQEANMDAGQQEGGRMNALAHATLIYCLRNNTNTAGMIPVQSSWVQQVGAKDGTLWFKYKDWPGYAGYQFTDKDKAFQAALSAMEGTTRKWGESGSTGAWIWENIWAPGTKPFSKGPRPTNPGINDFIEGMRLSKDPFSYDGGPSFDRWEGSAMGGQGEWEAKSAYLVEGEPQKLLGTEATGAPQYLDPSYTKGQWDTPWATGGKVLGTAPNYTGFPTISGKAKTSENPLGAGRKKKRGRKVGTTGSKGQVIGTQSVEYVPAQYYNSALRTMSFSRANNLFKESNGGQGISKSTWNKFMHFLHEFEQETIPRFNSVDIGNPMNFDLPLRYASNNSQGYDEEYACKREWKKIQEHEGKLYLYRDLKHGGEKVNVGTYKYHWDPDNDSPKITRDYDDEKIRNLLDTWQPIDGEWNQNKERILSRLNKSLPLPMSTEYFCSIEVHNGKRYQTRFHNGQGEPYLKGIAIVGRGNCDEPFCKFERQEE